jgi:hypothetical protein
MKAWEESPWWEKTQVQQERSLDVEKKALGWDPR